MRGSEVGADNDDGVWFSSRHFGDTVLDGLVIHGGEREIILQAKMCLCGTMESEAFVSVQYSSLYTVNIRCDETIILDLRRRQNLIECKHRCGCGNAGSLR